ncbi:MAG: P-type conjugative transfer protein TrbJ [Desulfobulbus sp.]|nr:P-type conjugative transfer protein TrbJ [Desulfobulbus sp.]
MKKQLLAVALSVAVVQPVAAEVVFCTNCSNLFTQALDRVTNVSQLSTLTSQYTEAIQQTAKQIQMVQNMMQNTTSLPGALKKQFAGQLTKLASLTSTLKTQRGELTALAEVFNTLFPEQSVFADLAGATPAEIAAANQAYRDHYNAWSGEVDKASQATFQLSGEQLQELQDAGELESYINNLLDTPDGQMKALQAGNQLATIQVQEVRKLRELIATNTQSTLAGQMKAEKESQMQAERWQSATSTEGYDFSKYSEAVP